MRASGTVSAYHGNAFSLHLANPGEDIRVEGVRNGELSKGVRLQLRQLFAAMVDRTADVAFLPSRMIHVSQLVQLRLELFLRPPLLRQRQVSRNSGPLWNKLCLHLGDGSRQLPLHLGPYARRPEEESIEDSSGGGNDVLGRADDAATLDDAVASAGPS